MTVESDLPKRADAPAVIALGLFDGMHRGHCAVIRAAVDAARRIDATPAVFTFTMPHTRPRKKQRQESLLSDADRVARCAALGVEIVYMPDFDRLKDIPAAAFIKDILLDRLHAVHLVCGYDFRFGAGAAGDSALLSETARRHGCAATVLPCLDADGAPISSTRIRALLQDGDIEQANALLGYAYGFTLPVISGKRIGHKLGFPTVNQRYPDGFVLPKFGVYAAAATVDGVRYPAVTNIGVKPTVGGAVRPLAETYILGVERDLYGQMVGIELYAFLRPEQKFPSLDALRAAIAENARQAQACFDRRTESARRD